jgi:2-haloacid dehalogenase
MLLQFVFSHRNCRTFPQAELIASELTAKVIKEYRLKALAFDAYGTLFDVFSVQGLCEALFPGRGMQLAEVWRKKQLEYSWLRSLMGRYRDFWAVTEDALVYSAKTLNLEMTARVRAQLMDSYLHLTTFPDVKPGLAEVRQIGLRVAILSNGEPNMLKEAVESAGLSTYIDVILSVDSVKVFKPSAVVYDRLPSDLKIDKREIGFVSSNNWDVNGAGSAGLTTFWIQRSGSEAPEELGYPASHIVNAVTDLGRLISGSPL